MYSQASKQTIIIMTVTYWIKSVTVSAPSSLSRVIIIIIMSVLLGNGKIEHMDACICPGYEVTYQCTVCSEGATVWTGSLFDCAGDEITLRHGGFESGSRGECNNGAVVASSIGVMDTNGSHCYVSQLSFIANSDHDNKTVTCLHVSSTNVTFIDETTIFYGTGPFPPPNNIHISEISPTVLKLSWNQSFSYCPSVEYIITSTAFGSSGACPNTIMFINATTILYTNVFTIGHNCSFSVETEICGNITGGKSFPIEVTFKVPDPPLFALSGNYYSSNDKTISTAFYLLNPFNISNGVDGSAIFYTITYTDAISNSSCHLATVPASNCINGVCYSNYAIQSDSVIDSTCTHSINISVRISATNVLGKSSESLPIYISIVADTAEIMSYTYLDIIISTGVLTGIMIITLITIMMVIAAVRIIRRKNNRSKASAHIYATPDGSCDLMPITSRNLDTSAEQGSGPLYADIGPFIKESSIAHSQFLDDNQIEYAEIKQHPVLITDEAHKQRLAVDEFLNLDSLLVQLCPHITPKWYEFGVAIGVTKEVLDKCLDYPPGECVTEVLDYWLRTSTTKPTWKDVAEGLHGIGFQKMAETLLKVYETGTLPIKLEPSACKDALPLNDIDTKECPPPLPPKKS